MKQCTKCKKEKEIVEFGIRKRKKDGHRECCKACHTTGNKIYSKTSLGIATINKYAQSSKRKLYMKDYWKKYIKSEKRIKYLERYCRTEQYKLSRNRSERKRLNNNINFKLTKLLRARVRNYVKGRVKLVSSVKDLGCTIPELKTHLEKQFKQDMTWENHGEWHIDHIIPLSSFDLTNREQFLKACHYTNLQPLWAQENLKKSNKLP